MTLSEPLPALFRLQKTHHANDTFNANRISGLSWFPNSFMSWAGAAILAYLLLRIIQWARYPKSPVRVIYSAWSAPVPSNNIKIKEKSIVQLLKENIPSIFGPEAYFRPIPWLRGGHMQTMFCSIGDFSQVDPVAYQRKFLRVPEGGIVAIDIFPPLDSHPPLKGENVAVVLHGLTGGSHESYVRAALFDLTKPKSEGGLGMRAVVMNFRGCAGSPIATRRLYHAGDTNDLRATMLYLTSSVFSDARYFGIGFSLGANALTKFCGEEGENCPLSAAVSIANVWDFLRGSYHISNGTLLNRYVYDGVLGGALQSLLKRHKHAFPETAPGAPYLPVEQICNAKTMNLQYFDDHITGPSFGFKNAYDYYCQISSTRFVDGIRIPLLGLNALDDPIVSHTYLPDCQVFASPWVVLATTAGGGHMGWFERGLKRWFVKPTHEFMDTMIQAELKTRPMPKALLPDEKGMVCQEGRPDIGFLVVDSKTLELANGDATTKLFSGW